MKRKDLNQLWNSVREGLFPNELEKKSNLSILLDGTRMEEINEKSSTVVISAPTDFSVTMLETPDFKKEIVRVTTEVLNSDFNVLIVEKDNWDARDLEDTTNEIEVMTVSDSLNSNYTIENFIVAESTNQTNMRVKKTALGVALKPGQFNPFFIHGGSGLGKTHLLHAIGNKMHESFPALNVRYLESKDFKDLVYNTKITTEKINKITSELFAYDVLLVDDIQMLQSLEKGKSVFFDILSHFIINNKQIVVTADKYPEEMKDFEERFITRFKGGVVLSVTPPDLETAKAILKSKLETMGDGVGIKLDNTALEFMAINFGSNVRELEGAVNRIILDSITSVEDQADVLTIDNMTDIFDGLSTNEGITMKRIVEVVCKHYQVKTSDVLGKSRKAEIALPRHVAIYFSKTLLDVGLIDIGRYFSRNHTTVMASVSKIKRLSASDPDMGATIYELRKKIK